MITYSSREQTSLESIKDYIDVIIERKDTTFDNAMLHISDLTKFKSEDCCSKFCQSFIWLTFGLIGIIHSYMNNENFTSWNTAGNVLEKSLPMLFLLYKDTSKIQKLSTGNICFFIYLTAIFINESFLLYHMFKSKHNSTLV